MAKTKLMARAAPALALILAMIAFAAGPASAQEERVAALQIEVLRSASGTQVVPVRVTAVSQRAIDAVLEVRLEQLSLSWEIPLALAANSEVGQLLTVPVSGGDFEVQAFLFVDGEEVAEASTRAQGANDNAVGLLGLSAPAADVQLEPNIGQASLIELNDLRILAALDTVVASPAGLRTLTGEEQAQLLQWVSTGRQLAIAAEPGTIDDLVPSEWTGSGAVIPADAGMIRYVGANWADRVPPGLSAAVSPFSLTNGLSIESQELLNDAGFSVPSLGVMSLLLLVYLLVAGPLAFAVLTVRKQQTLAWVVIPALAVLFTAGVFGVGRMLNSGRRNAHATIVSVSPVGASVSDTVLVARSGRRTLELPEGWDIVGTGEHRNFGNRGASAPITIFPSRSTTDLAFDIDPGSGGTAVFTGFDASIISALEVGDLSLDGTTLSGSVSNNSGERLNDVIVMVGSRQNNVGDVDDGAVATFSIQLDANPNRFAPELRTWDVDPRDRFDFRFQNEGSEAVESGPVNGSAWLAWRAANFGSAVPDGMVTAVGWSRDLDLSVQGGTGRTAIVARSALPDPTESVLPAQIRVLRLAVPAGNQFDGFEPFDGFRQQLVTQFVRPPGADTSEIALGLQRNVSELAAWVGGEWRFFDITAGDGPIAIPDEAWEDDSLTVQYTLGEFFGDPRQLTTEVVPLTAGTVEVALLPSGESAKREAQFDGGFDEFGGAELGAVNVIESTLAPGEPGSFSFDIDGELFGTFDEWSLDLEAGDVVDVRMTANGFGGGQLDPQLIIRGPAGQQIAENDDFDGLNSRIELTIAEAGTHVIEARPLGGVRSGGSYTLSVLVDREGTSE